LQGGAQIAKTIAELFDAEPQALCFHSVARRGTDKVS
jgi:hypothetical protein